MSQPSLIRHHLLRLPALAALVALAPAAVAAPVPVTVSIPPQKWLVQQVAGPHATVSVMVGQGQSPENFAPTPRQVADLQQAQAYFSAGVAFELGLLPRLRAMPQGPRLAGRVPLNDRHGTCGDGEDPHAWLDPREAAAFADTVCRVLSELAPAQAADFAAGRDALRARLAALEAECAARLADCRGREFFVFHPAYGHLAARYGLVQVAVEDHGHEPGARHLAEVITRAKAAGARAILVQPQFPQRSAESVATAVGARLVVADPLPADYEAGLRSLVEALVEAMGCDGSSAP
ncbi:MAG: zinc ABC transporter substrate-binding protein [bacterium]|nr:zinc ABC transporter substrate-binding protein [bacterium]